MNSSADPDHGIRHEMRVNARYNQYVSTALEPFVDWCISN
jgi:hypothetical protein